MDDSWGVPPLRKPPYVMLSASFNPRRLSWFSQLNDAGKSKSMMHLIGAQIFHAWLWGQNDTPTPTNWVSNENPSLDFWFRYALGQQSLVLATWGLLPTLSKAQRIVTIPKTSMLGFG